MTKPKSKYQICIGITDECALGYGIFKYGKDITDTMTPEEKTMVNLMLMNVQMNLYHKDFFEQYKKCPCENLHSVFIKDKPDPNGEIG